MLTPDNRVIMISGANRGIGLAIARALYDGGYSLSLGARNPASLAVVTSGWATERVLTGHYDAEDQATHREWVDATVERFGRLDGLVNNAGIAEDVSDEDENDEDPEEDQQEVGGPQKAAASFSVWPSKAAKRESRKAAQGFISGGGCFF